MGYSVRSLFLIALLSSASAMALKPGDPIPDFAMPADKGWPKRISEQLGEPVLLVWLAGCDGCDKDLAMWQDEIHSAVPEGLTSWFLYRPEEGDKTANAKWPMLKYSADNQQAWWFKETPAVMLVSPDGIVDHLFIKDVEYRKKEIAAEVASWLDAKAWLQPETE